MGIIATFQFSQIDLARILLASGNVVTEAKRLVLALPKQGAIEYAGNVLAAISSQKYGWAAHSAKYQKWKLRVGASLYKWVLSGDLLANIKPHSIMRGGITMWFSGISSNAMSTGAFGTKSKPIVDYAYSLEYGGVKKNMPARPLFRPEFEIYKGIWGLKIMQAKGSIRKQWR